MLKLIKKKTAATDSADKAGAARKKKPQGIVAKSSALRTIGLIALLIMLVPAGLGFSYLLTLREPALQAQQVDVVSSSFAVQQATNVHHLFSRMINRVHSAAQSPLALSAIASRTADDLALVEKAMLDYFPEVIGLRIIPIGDMGTADFENGNQGLRNHIEVDMVRRANIGESAEPQAYKFEDQWLTSIAERVTHPRYPDSRAVIIVTINNEQISQQLKSLGSDVGKFSLEQRYLSSTGAKRVDIIAASGSASDSPHKRYAQVPDTSWFVSFSPSQSLLSTLDVAQAPTISVLVLIILAALGSTAFILILFPRKLETEVNSVIAAADKKSPLSLDIPELVPIAKQLRRATLRALSQSNSTSGAIPTAEVETIDVDSDDLSNPIFQSDPVLDQNDDFLDLELNTTATEPAAEAVPNNIFRAYDIRGNADSELNDTLITQVGLAIGSIAADMGEETLIVACDGRLSSPRIKSALARALMDAGRDVIDIGLVPTPLLYFATRHLNCGSGVMITGSHNPANHNGLKVVLNQQTIAAGGIKNIRDRVISGDFVSGNGSLTEEDIIPAYMDAVIQDIAIAVPLRVVIDAGNGATSEIAPRLFEELGCEVVELNCVIDGHFPNHAPDTSNEENLAGLVMAIKEVGADFGVAFDGDGDRLAVVTPAGHIVRSDVLLMLYAQDVVSRNPGADVVFDVKCSRNLTKVITRHGGRPVLWKTGHAFMKEKMAETGALLGGEFSGHMFFGERWYGFDDGMYAAGRLAEILSTDGDSLDESIAQLPSAVNTPEIIIPVDDDYKFQLVDKIVSNADFSSGKVNTMDGIRVDFNTGWGLIRASNTGPALTARFEADTQEDLEQIQDEFRSQVALIDPDIELGF